MPSYKLNYFNLRGRGETIRYVLHAAEVPFEDNRIEFADWPALKSSSPLGQLPYFEADGISMVQSMAIARHVARQHGFAGKTPVEEYRADAAVDTITDLMQEFYTNIFKSKEEDKEANKKKFIEETIPSFADRLVRLIKFANDGSSDGYFAGNAITWADLAWATNFESLVKVDPDLASKHPDLARIKEAVDSLPGLAKYLATRPQTDI